MIRFATTLFVFICFSQNLIFGQHNIIDFELKEIKQIDNSIKSNDSIFGTIKGEGETIELCLYNKHTDTVYLLSSYFNEELIRSKYLHRINKKEKKYKVSFLPIRPFLGLKRPDVIVLGENRIIKQNQVLYSFIDLPPNTMLCLKLNLKTDDVQEYVKDVNLKKIGRYDKLRFKAINKKPKGLTNHFEFAVYFNTSLLKDYNAYYLKEFEFNKQAQNYILLDIPYCK